MKTLSFSLLLFLSCNTYAGQESCFVAIDTSQMTASIQSEIDDTIKIEQIVGAALKIEVGSKMYDGTVAILQVETASGLRGSSVSGFQREEQRFQVECDGGSMTVKKQSRGKRIMKSDGIRADVEGCDGYMHITTEGTMFSPVLCEAPTAN